MLSVVRAPSLDPTAIGPFVSPSQLRAGTGLLDAHGYDSDEIECLRRALGYTTDFLARSHPELGRSGPVCPFIRGAIRGDFLHLAASRIDLGRIDELEALAESLFVTFDRYVMESDDIDERLFASLIVVFPRLVTDAGFRAVERTQMDAKPAFVERGYMIGEFYPGNRAPGLHNPDFHPLDAPYASLAMRRMTISDAPFMLGNRSFETAFVHFFGRDGEASLEQAAARYGNGADMRDDRAMQSGR